MLSKLLYNYANTGITSTSDGFGKKKSFIKNIYIKELESAHRLISLRNAGLSGGQPIAEEHQVKGGGGGR